MKTKINDYDWKEVQNYYNQCLNQKQTKIHFSISSTVFQKAKKLNKIICNKRPKCNEETKRKISEKRKETLRKNHPWSKKTKFYSSPCQLFKQFLRENNVNFLQQYMNPNEWKRNFAIDIAFIQEKIGIEINGNQHYERNGQLKQYYQQRHDILEEFGWKIIQVPYLMVWNDDFRNNILKEIKDQVNINYDYSEYVKQKLQQKENRYICIKCGQKKKTKESKMCSECASLFNGTNRRKVERPSKEQLQKQISENSFVSLGKKYGVSDNAIRKWCKFYGLL